MNQIFRALSYLSLIVGTATAGAQTLNLQNLSGDDYGKVVDNLSANFSHTSVSGASPLGHIFGFEFGIVGGQTRTPDINRLVKASDPSADASKVPMAELLGVLTVPAGITIEAGLVPKIGSDKFHFNSMSLAAKWTATELLELPFSLAVKGHLTSFNMDSHQSVTSVATNTTVDTTYKYKSTITGLTVFASKDFMIVEPYAGLGVVSATGDMDVTGVSAFASGAGSASAKRSSSEFLLGAELKLVVFKLGVEYGHLFGVDRFAGKLSFYF